MAVTAVDGLDPQYVWKRFYEISRIPRPSKNEERIRLYLRNFAGARNLKMKEDDVGNILIMVEATPGNEKLPTVVLQSHVDMVCEKNKDIKHDFNVDPIELERDGNWLKAKGTTLGADNGIGVAAALAIASDDSFAHGPIELLFTVDEETGLTGVNSLQNGFIKGKYLINLDTEEDGSFYVGCSGGMDTAGEFEIEWENVRKDYAPYWLFITGLKGGHSGLNINEKRGNAIKLLAYLLSDLKQFNYQIGYLGGGSKRNAIPREAEALIYINPDNDFKVREIINDFALSSALEFKSADDGIKITFDIKEDAAGDSVLSDTFFNKVLDVILAMPHGPIAMSSDIPGLVETSTNLATITINENTLSIGTSQRSSIENAKKNIGLSVKSIFDLSQDAKSILDASVDAVSTLGELMEKFPGSVLDSSMLPLPGPVKLSSVTNSVANRWWLGVMLQPNWVSVGSPFAPLPRSPRTWSKVRFSLTT